MEKEFKILTIDGGGIKGLYSSIIIKHLEEQYGPISDYFDMICEHCGADNCGEGIRI